VSRAPKGALVRRSDLVLTADPSRVVATIFLPGQEIAASGESRSTAVLDRILALDEDVVSSTVAALRESFLPRHPHLASVWEANARLVEHRLVDHHHHTPDRRALIGAYFTQEYAIEAAALFNPSMVLHPDQSGLPSGSARFIMSLRGVGEGHISSVEWRTGVVDAQDDVTLDAVTQGPLLPAFVPVPYERSTFEQQMAELGGDHSDSDFVLDSLPDTFSRYDLDIALADLEAQRLTRRSAIRTVDRFRRVAACNYTVEFPEASTLDQRVLMPRGPSEAHGLEDLRLVRLSGPDGPAGYVGTYTAYDGSKVVPQVVRTRDFRTFQVSQLSGPGAKNKGLALFPRQVGGRYLALSRADRESNALTSSVDLRTWDKPRLLQSPAQAWEIIQLGNCGPPLETTAGWLVLTHGVGPMRTYGIGALLLDLDDPSVVLGQLTQPLLTPAADERDGYVPNVVYSCGGLVHGDTLVLPYGCSDSAIRLALVDIPQLLAALQP
jgi:predicted GH43/DUF377 family glycosyl hydrolase